MKRTWMFTTLIVLLMLGLVSCNNDPRIAALDSYHSDLNTGEIERALSYVAEGATFKVDAAPIPGANGLYTGKEAIRGWLNDIADAGASLSLTGMTADEDRVICWMSYKDDFLELLNLDGLDVEETTVIQNGLVQSYSLVWMPAADDQLERAITETYTNFSLMDPADRKFYSPGYGPQADPSLPWLRMVDPADRKFYFQQDALSLHHDVRADSYDQKFFNEGYPANAP